MKIKVLGPLEVEDDQEQRVPLPRAQARLLCLLVVSANQPISVERLAEDFWEGSPPATATTTLRAHLSRLRQALGDAQRIDTIGTSYLLRLGPGESDVDAFSQSVARGRSLASGGNHADAADALREALSLWRGSAFLDVSECPLAKIEAIRLDEARLTVTEERYEAELAAGHHDTLIGELEALCTAHPWRERLWSALITALYRAGRQAEALRSYQLLRERLIDELGIEPSPDLARLEAAVLAQDPSLDLPGVRVVAEVPGTLPRGIVTLMATDIEGSSRWWEVAPTAMALGLERHDLIVGEAVRANGGTVFKSVGDGVMAAFAEPLDAVTAALRAQEALRQESWPAPLALKVRIALNTGPVEERNGDYLGPTINRLARIEGLAHGGQIVCSAATSSTLSTENLVVTELGLHPLRGMEHPELLFQLQRPGDPEVFPPLRGTAPPPPRHNIPTRRSSFIGRQNELAELAELIPTNQLVTMTGPGGSGKTSLALRLASDRVGRVEGGTWLVELAPLTDPGQIDDLVAVTLGIPENPGRSLRQSVIDFLRPKSDLVILDNCEHLIAAAAGWTDEVLRACPQLHVLATSRGPLRLAGEHIFILRPLATPRESTDLLEMSEFDAVQLFTERALVHQPRFVLHTGNVAQVAAVCRRLDGIPLAIELAAARLKVMSVEDLVLHLDDRFNLLAGGDSPESRHETLALLIDWSYRLLSDAHRSVLCRASVFADGFTLEGAAEVCMTDDMTYWQVVDAVSLLVDECLLEADVTDGTVRFRMLETIRAFADHHLDDAQRERLFEAFVNYQLMVVERAAPQLFRSDLSEWLHILDGEMENNRLAISLTERTGQGDKLARFALALRRYLWVRGRLREIWDLARSSLSFDVSPWARAGLLSMAGQALTYLGETHKAVTMLEEGLVLAADLDDHWLLADLNWNTSFVKRRMGQAENAIRHADVALEEAEALGDPFRFALILGNHAIAIHDAQDPLPARTEFLKAIELNEELGTRFEAMKIAGNLAVLEIDTGQFEDARERLESVVIAAAEFGNASGRAYIHENLASARLGCGDIAGAMEQSVLAMRAGQLVGDAHCVTYGVFGVARAAVAMEHYVEGAMLFGCAEQLLAENSEEWEPGAQQDALSLISCLNEVFDTIESERHQEAGRRLTESERVSLVDRVSRLNDQSAPPLPI